MTKYSGLGDRILGRLQSLGYRKRDRPDVLRFCREKGYRPQYVYAWAKDRVPTYENLKRLAHDLDVSMAWILFGRAAGQVSPADLPRRLLQAFGGHAALALETAQLFEEHERRLAPDASPA